MSPSKPLEGLFSMMLVDRLISIDNNKINTREIIDLYIYIYMEPISLDWFVAFSITPLYHILVFVECFFLKSFSDKSKHKWC